MNLFKYLIILLPLYSVYWLPLSKINIGGYQFNITLFDINVLLLFLIYLIKYKSRIVIDKQRKYLIIFCWLIILPSILSCLILTTYREALSDLITYTKRIGEFSLLILIIPGIISNKEKLYSLYSVNIIGIIVSINAIIEFKKAHRAGSWLFYANNLGLYSVVVFNTSISLFIFSKNKKLKYLGLITSIISIMALWVSGSRAASVGFLFSSFYWILVKWPQKIDKIKMSIIIIILIFISLSYLGHEELDLLSRWHEFTTGGLDTIQVSSRLEASKVGTHIILNYPILGVGIHNVPFFSSEYIRYSKYFLPTETVDNLGNQYLQILAEGGIIGFSFFVMFVFQLLKILKYRILCYKNVLNQAIKSALIASTIAFITSGFGMHTFYVPQVMALYWFLLGMLYVK